MQCFSLVSRFIPFLILFSIFTVEIATDFYLLSFPEMETILKGNEHLLQGTLTAYLLGFSLLGLISGPLSDSIGRRPVTLGGLLVFAMGSGLCCVVPDVYSLIGCRFIQGLGAGVICVVLTAVIKDLYDDIKSSRLMASMSIIIALSPLIAPTVGNYVSQLWGWAYAFKIILALGIVSLFLSYFILPESVNPKNAPSFLLKNLGIMYVDLFKQKLPVVYSCISGFSYGSLWIWIITSPFYIVNNLNVSIADYEYYAAICPIFYVIGTFVNKHLLGRFGLLPLLKGGLVLMGVGGGVLLSLSQINQVTLEFIFIALAVYSLGLAPVFANAATLSITVNPTQRGTASALLTSIELICAAICTFLASQLDGESLLSISLGMLSCSFFCVIFLNLIKLKCFPQVVQKV